MYLSYLELASVNPRSYGSGHSASVRAEAPPAAAVLTSGSAVRHRAFGAIQGWRAMAGKLCLVGAKGPHHTAAPRHQLLLTGIPANGALMVYRCDRRATNASSCALSDPGKDTVPDSPGPVALSWHDLHTTRLTDPRSCGSHTQDFVQLCSPDRPEAPQQPQTMPTSSRRSSAAEIFTRENERERPRSHFHRAHAARCALRQAERGLRAAVHASRRGEPVLARPRGWSGGVGSLAAVGEAEQRSACAPVG